MEHDRYICDSVMHMYSLYVLLVRVHTYMMHKYAFQRKQNPWRFITTLIHIILHILVISHFQPFYTFGDSYITILAKSRESADSRVFIQLTLWIHTYLYNPQRMGRKG